MTVFFVSRHQGSIDWAKAQGIKAQFLAHLDVTQVQADDTVIGTLPFHLVEKLQEKAARYIHLSIPLAQTDRGRELDQAQLHQRAPALVEYRLTRIAGHDPTDFS